jgi:hypothetical protein
LKVIFDHNISPKIARALGELFLDFHEVVALKDKFPPNTPDVDWIHALNKEGGWVVISGDRRITRNKTEYNAFRSSSVVGFFLSKGLQKAAPIKQMERILAQWDSIEKQVALVKGGGMFELQMKGTQLSQLKP